jgi:hypothetical protein
VAKHACVRCCDDLLALDYDLGLEVRCLDLPSFRDLNHDHPQCSQFTIELSSSLAFQSLILFQCHLFPFAFVPIEVKLRGRTFNLKANLYRFYLSEQDGLRFYVSNLS